MKDIISKNHVIGNCRYCQSQNVAIYPSLELSNFLKGVVNLYEVNPVEGKPLEEQIIVDFEKKAFTQKLIEAKGTKRLITDALQDDPKNYSDILNKPVQLKYLHSNFEEAIIKPLSLSWDTFSDEIKTVNRFHLINVLDLERLKFLFKHFSKDISRGEKFYRARISNNLKGYPLEEMGNPPSHLAKGGRANPDGISYLYLAGDTTTAIYEARASLFDYVSIGAFDLESDIRIVNLSRSTYDIFRLAESELLEDVMMHVPFVDKLENELSRPRRKNDSELDYLPTQYLSELVKVMGFDGIEFKSSLYSKGYNIAIFYPNKLKCTSVSVYDVHTINFEYRAIDK